MRSELLDPIEHASELLESVDGDLPALRELLPCFIQTWRDEYGERYTSMLLTMLTEQGQA